jgi:BirA family biotin operon repressor/biotin-[acetyl-CoA-carboxylase] ligase
LPSPNLIGKPFIELLSVESTNNYAMGLARAGMAQHGLVVFAHEQTNGKGQRNKGWASQKGQNIAMSIVVEPQALPSSQIFVLSMVAAVAVQEFFCNYIGSEIKIKWPNDIYWRDRKAAGILIENVWQGSEWRFAVIGIGINVNQTDFGELGTRAVSFKQITGKHFDPLLLAKELCDMVEEKFQLLKVNAPRIIAKYKAGLYKLNERVKLKKDNRVFEAKFVDVTIDGQMLVRHSVEEKFAVGEVEWMIKDA